MKIRDLRQKSKEELAKLLQDSRNDILSLRFDIAGGRVKNVKSMHEAKKDIARILTLLKQ
jgi:large subunit ribosomal protein L29